MRVDFHKMHGAGNDFVVLDQRGQSSTPNASAIARLADRHTGIGCDQLVLLQDPDRLAYGPEPADVRARFFNPDGSEAGACGNATRCVAALVAGDRTGRVIRVQTAAGLLPARILEAGLVEVGMGKPGLDWRAMPLARPADTLHLPLDGDPAGCSIGNPHATLFDDPRDPAEAGPGLEIDALFPERANIGFASVLGRDRMRLRVWERGAGLTRACGSGACAAVVNAVRRGLTDHRVKVEMPGGVLEIDWDIDGIVHMTGPAVLSFIGQIELELTS